MIKSGVYSGEEMTQLEYHLKGQMEELMKKGLSEEEAFTIGSRRIETSSDLITKEVNGDLLWRKHLLKFLAGLYGFIVLKFLVPALTNIFTAGIWALGGKNLSAAPLYQGIYTALTFLLFYLVFSRKISFLTVIQHKISSLTGRMKVPLVMTLAVLVWSLAYVIKHYSLVLLYSTWDAQSLYNVFSGSLVIEVIWISAVIGFAIYNAYLCRKGLNESSRLHK